MGVPHPCACASPACKMQKAAGAEAGVREQRAARVPGESLLSVARRPCWQHTAPQHPDFAPDVTGSSLPQESEGAGYFRKINDERREYSLNTGPQTSTESVPDRKSACGDPEYSPISCRSLWHPPPLTPLGWGRPALSARRGRLHAQNLCSRRTSRFGRVFKGLCVSGFRLNASAMNSSNLTPTVSGGSSSPQRPPLPGRRTRPQCGQ